MIVGQQQKDQHQQYQQEPPQDDDDDESIDSESILKNKAKLKRFWETQMEAEQQLRKQLTSKLISSSSSSCKSSSIPISISAIGEQQQQMDTNNNNSSQTNGQQQSKESNNQMASGDDPVEPKYHNGHANDGNSSDQNSTNNNNNNNNNNSNDGQNNIQNKLGSDGESEEWSSLSPAEVNSLDEIKEPEDDSTSYDDQLSDNIKQVRLGRTTHQVKYVIASPVETMSSSSSPTCDEQPDEMTHRDSNNKSKCNHNEILSFVAFANGSESFESLEGEPDSQSTIVDSNTSNTLIDLNSITNVVTNDSVYNVAIGDKDEKKVNSSCDQTKDENEILKESKQNEIDHQQNQQKPEPSRCKARALVKPMFVEPELAPIFESLTFEEAQYVSLSVPPTSATTSAQQMESNIQQVDSKNKLEQSNVVYNDEHDDNHEDDEDGEPQEMVMASLMPEDMTSCSSILTNGIPKEKILTEVTEQSVNDEKHEEEEGIREDKRISRDIRQDINNVCQMIELAVQDATRVTEQLLNTNSATRRIHTNTENTNTNANAIVSNNNEEIVKNSNLNANANETKINDDDQIKSDAGTNQMLLPIKVNVEQQAKIFKSSDNQINSSTAKSLTQLKIAQEIQELKERENELRRMRGRAPVARQRTLPASKSLSNHQDTINGEHQQCETEQQEQQEQQEQREQREQREQLESETSLDNEGQQKQPIENLIGASVNERIAALTRRAIAPNTEFVGSNGTRNVSCFKWSASNKSSAGKSSSGSMVDLSHRQVGAQWSLVERRKQQLRSCSMLPLPTDNRADHQGKQQSNDQMAYDSQEDEDQVAVKFLAETPMEAEMRRLMERERELRQMRNLNSQNSQMSQEGKSVVCDDEEAKVEKKKSQHSVSMTPVNGSNQKTVINMHKFIQSKGQLKMSFASHREGSSSNGSNGSNGSRSSFGYHTPIVHKSNQPKSLMQVNSQQPDVPVAPGTTKAVINAITAGQQFGLDQSDNHDKTNDDKDQQMLAANDKNISNTEDANDDVFVIPSVPSIKSKFSMLSMAANGGNAQSASTTTSTTASPRLASSAEHKIQAELREMRSREEELKQHRAHLQSLLTPQATTINTDAHANTNGQTNTNNMPDGKSNGTNADAEMPIQLNGATQPNQAQNQGHNHKLDAQTDHKHDLHTTIKSMKPDDYDSKVGGPRNKISLITKWEQQMINNNDNNEDDNNKHDLRS